MDALVQLIEAFARSHVEPFLMERRWAPGCDDGGAPILGYRVQAVAATSVELLQTGWSKR